MDRSFNIFVFSKAGYYEQLMRSLNGKLSDCKFIFIQNQASLSLRLKHNIPHLFIGELAIGGTTFFEAFDSIRSKNRHCSGILIDNQTISKSVVLKLSKLGVTDRVEKQDFDNLLMSIMKAKAYQLGLTFGAKNASIQNSNLIRFNSPTGLVLTDEDGYVEWVNSDFECICGYASDELIGKKPGHVLQGELTNAHTVQMIRENLADRVSFEYSIVNYHAKGYPYWISINISPLVLEDQGLKFIAIQSDTTTQMPALN